MSVTNTTALTATSAAAAIAAVNAANAAMVANATALFNNVDTYKYNPSGLQRAVLSLINTPIVDATNPFMFALESSSVLITGFMSENETNTRRRYPSLSQTQEDLYLHMSDEDYINRFCIPASGNFTFLIPQQKLINSMVYEPSTGYNKITIPRNTYFTVAGVNFSLQYPIDIRQLAHGGLQITYDTTEVSPLQKIATNTIDYQILTNQAGNWVQFTIPLMQFGIVSQIGAISQSGDLTMTVDITDQYYFARVYSQITNADGTTSWVEIKTTNSTEVYDPETPTAVIVVDGTTVTISIPQIYVNSGLLSGNIRADVYQSNGAINMPLNQYATNSFVIKWEAYDANDQTIYTAPWAGISVIGYSNDVVVDGSDEMSFETLRTNVIKNTTGPIDVSITPAQIKTALANQGYDIITSVDNITNRIMLATKAMPNPIVITPTTNSSTTGTPSQLLTAAGASIETITTTALNLSYLPTVVDNNTSVTITPNTIFQIVNGIVVPVSAPIMKALLVMSATDRATAVTNGNYLYTPFHYVLDMTNNALAMRPYYLDNPQITSKVFVATNDSTQINLSTNSFGIVRTTTGFLVQIKTLSDATYKAIPDNNVFAQLSFIPYGETNRAYVNGTLVGIDPKNGERIFNFDLSTTYNIDSNNNIELTKFTMYQNIPRITLTELTDSFDILYSTSAPMPSLWIPNAIDSILGTYLLPQQIAAITQETLNITFGNYLNTLWQQARTVVDSISYQTWAINVPKLYQETIYETDTNGSAISIVNGNPVMTIATGAGGEQCIVGRPVLTSTIAATCTAGTVTESVLTVDASSIPATGTWEVGQYLSGPGIVPGTIKIISNGTGAGNAGTYNLSGPLTITTGQVINAINPVYLHQVGDTVIDVNGNPVPVGPRGLMQQIDLFLIEGAYWFATDAVTTTYRAQMALAIVDWLMNDLEVFEGNLLDNTFIYFYPKTTSGAINVLIGNNVNTTILAGQAFVVTLTITNTVNSNADLLAHLTQITTTTIDAALQQTTVSLSTMQSALLAVYGDDVIDAQIRGLGGSNNYPVITLVDETDSLSISKMLVANPDNSLSAAENIIIEWVVLNA